MKLASKELMEEMEEDVKRMWICVFKFHFDGLKGKQGGKRNKKDDMKRPVWQ